MALSANVKVICTQEMKNSSSFSSVQSLDRVTPLKNRKEIKASIAASTKATRCDLLEISRKFVDNWLNNI